MIKNIKTFILNYCFHISALPMLYSELLEANKQLNNNMSLKAIDLGVKLRYGRAYFIFFILIHMLIIPLAYFAHFIFSKVDCHLSIIFAIIFTTIIFSFFGLFKEWLYDNIAAISVRKNWKIHFSYFEYKKYRYKVEKYYTQAKLNYTDKNDLENYITDKLTTNDK
ncbi:MAG: hypothetical protein DRG11_03885 [Epsilonproteobacteria bacterium]|nr:MAG: hypothetical protein DRG11_03885 [Campylobacterota bacterium]